jgi:hypothetical protein
MIPIVAGYSLRNLLCGELAVIIRMQDICYGIRICSHRFNNSLLPENASTLLGRKTRPFNVL